MKDRKRIAGDHEARRQPATHRLRVVFLLDVYRVAADDAIQLLHDADLLGVVAQVDLADECHRLSQQLRRAELVRKTVEAEADGVFLPNDVFEYALDRPLARSWDAVHDQELVLRQVARQAVPEPLLKKGDPLGISFQHLIEKRQPLRAGGVLVEIERQADRVVDDPLTTQLLDSIGGFDAINRSGGWNEITQPMQTDDLVALTKGLTLAEKHHSWIGGSVAAVIWTFRELQRRDSALADEVANWILPRTANPYVPYGSRNRGARTVEEYRKTTQWRTERIQAGLADQKAGEERAKAERELSTEQRKRSARDRDSEIRKRLIAELVSLQSKSNFVASLRMQHTL